MRAVCFVFLLLFLAAIGVFAYHNQQEITLTFWEDRTLTASVPLVIACVYLLGMLSGWTVLGMLRRSVDRVIETPQRERSAS